MMAKMAALLPMLAGYSYMAEKSKKRKRKAKIESLRKKAKALYMEKTRKKGK